MKNSLSSLSDLAAAFGKAPIEPNKSTPASDDSLVYSTDTGRINKKKEKTVTPSDGFARVRRETKGRKGKGVVVISGLGLDNKALKELAKKLKKTCGSGGSVVGETIEVQGDKREVIQQVLEKAGFNVKFTGG
ncbi:stress response translation initiation inhibitor YciH [Colwellia marinimaniae]|uniref:Translation initiation factor n=1 Tax=Colwellia marinimaniae TaxID=1513592 RepID=A0ABQ0MT48_9GAMM|nr:translation initiation factor [Colwellia marinimaniae]